MKARKTPVERELDRIARREAWLQQQAGKYHGAAWKEELERRIPEKVLHGLQSAFCKAFEMIFERGTALIEKTYSREALEKDFQVRDYAVRLKGVNTNP